MELRLLNRGISERRFPDIFISQIKCALIFSGRIFLRLFPVFFCQKLDVYARIIVFGSGFDYN